LLGIRIAGGHHPSDNALPEFERRLIFIRATIRSDHLGNVIVNANAIIIITLLEDVKRKRRHCLCVELDAGPDSRKLHRCVECDNLARRAFASEQLRPSQAIRQSQPALLRDLIRDGVEKLERCGNSLDKSIHQPIAITGLERKSSRSIDSASTCVPATALAIASATMPSIRPVAFALSNFRLPAGSEVATALAAHMAKTG